MSWAAVAAATVGTVGGKLLSGGGQSQVSQNGTSSNASSSTSTGTNDGTTSSTSTPNLPQWLIDLMQKANGNLNANGANTDQQDAADYLKNNLTNNGINQASATAGGATENAFRGLSGAATTAGNGASTAADYLKNNLNNGSFTLGAYFGAAPTISAASSADPTAVVAGRGADYAGSYATPLNDAYVNSSLAAYDDGAAKGFNALRASNASAFGNKRTGVAEGQFQADSALGRGNLAANLNLNAFNTAIGQGQTDASRALAAGTTNAANGLSNSQFNANLAQSANQFNSNLINNRQQFDLGQAVTGDQARQNTAMNLAGITNTAGNTAANIATAGANVGTNNLSNAINTNSANVNNANAVGNINNMTFDQLMKMIQSGQLQIGQTNNGTSSNTVNSTTNGTSNGTSTGSGTSSQPYDYAGNFANLLLAGSKIGSNSSGSNPIVWT